MDVTIPTHFAFRIFRLHSEQLDQVVFFRPMILDHHQQILQAIQSWTLLKSLNCHVGNVTQDHETWSVKSVISVIVGLVEPETYIDLLYSLASHIEDSSDVIRGFVVDGHICPYISISYGSVPYQVFISPVSTLSFRKDDALSKFLDTRWTGLKVSRDGLAMRTLLVPRMYSLLSRELGKSREAFGAAMRCVLSWAMGRGIFDRFDNGYLTQEVLVAMMLFVMKHRLVGTPDISGFHLVRKFFNTFADWDYNEASVGGNVCIASDPYGSTINEDEGIDSDVDEKFRANRIAQRMHATNAEEATGGDAVMNGPHSLKQDEDDEVLVHKRTRSDLGRIRDIRRFYTMNEMGEKYFGNIVHSGSSNPSMKPLDWLDVLLVAHPFECSEFVNLAIRVQESNKKIIFQEILRARLLLEDTHCADKHLDGLIETICHPPVERSVMSSIEICIRSENIKVAEIVGMYVADAVWFLIQELQAWQGVMVIPPSEASPVYPAGPGSFTQKIFIGLAFVSEAPYGARAGMKLDFMGPLMRAMTRCREKLRERPDYEKSIENRFTVEAGGVAHNRPQNSP